MNNIFVILFLTLLISIIGCNIKIDKYSGHYLSKDKKYKLILNKNGTFIQYYNNIENKGNWKIIKYSENSDSDIELENYYNPKSCLKGWSYLIFKKNCLYTNLENEYTYSKIR